MNTIRKQITLDRMRVVEAIVNMLELMSKRSGSAMLLKTVYQSEKKTLEDLIWEFDQ